MSVNVVEERSLAKVYLDVLAWSLQADGGKELSFDIAEGGT